MAMKKTVFLTGASGTMGWEGFKQFYAKKNQFNIVVLLRDSEKNRKKFAPYMNDSNYKGGWWLDDAAQPADWFDLAVRWKNPGQSESEERHYSVGSQNALAELDDDMLFAASIIETAMLLHKSEYKGNATLDSVQALLGDMSEKDAYQAEFEQLIRVLREGKREA